MPYCRDACLQSNDEDTSRHGLVHSARTLHTTDDDRHRSRDRHIASSSHRSAAALREKENLCPTPHPDDSAAARARATELAAPPCGGGREARLERTVADLTMELRRAALSAKAQARTA
jgi:hypothetical protein